MSHEDPRLIRTPADIGYLAWLLHRLSAVALIVLIVIHIGVQLQQGSVFRYVRVWGIYAPLLDLTLGLVLLHGFIGVYVTIFETTLRAQWKYVLTTAIGVGFLLLFLYRIFG